MEWFPILIIILNYVRNTSNKFKKPKVKKKIIIESGPHYRYIADLW